MSTGDTVIELEKCKGILIPGLTKIQQQQDNYFPLTSKGGQYLEDLLLKLLSALLGSQPKNTQDALDQIAKRFPEPLTKWALVEARTAQEKGKKKVAFSVDKLHHALKEQNPGMEKQVTLMFSAVLEYMASDVLKLTTNYAKNISSDKITDQDIKIAMFADNILMDLFHCDEMDDEIVETDAELEPFLKVEKHVSYESLVRDFMSEESSYLRDLNLIIKLIKREFEARKDLYTEADIDTIFSNVEDLAELSLTLIGLLEEAVEMTDETSPIPLVGSCFEDLAEEWSFDCYSDYTFAITDKGWRDTFDGILMQASVTAHLQSVCPGFRNVVAYVLPNLLLAPIYHCFHYFEQIKTLEKNSPDPDDRHCLAQALGAMATLKQILEAETVSLPKLRPSEASLRISWRGGPKATKMSDIEKSIDGWWGRSITQVCNEFLHEGTLSRVGNKRTSERHVFLFDHLLISCKNNQGRLPTGSQYEYRLKERILIRKATVKDDLDDPGKNQFLVIEGEKSRDTHIFQAKTKADKCAWMAHLIRLQHRSTFDRMLDQIIREEAANQELRLPTAAKYRFAEPDSRLNLILEENEETTNNHDHHIKGNADVIKGGTVLKLVERLTYHLYSDPSFTKTFLTTFRSFCKPRELLELLKERYDIPEPPPTEQQQMAIDRGEIPHREDLKRFRKEYAKPIQIRVMNVVRQWLEHHWYDFERDAELLADVKKFIGSVRGKNMQKWARTMQKIISRKKDTEEAEPEHSFAKDSPQIEWHLTQDPSKFNLFTLHPIEIARQLTLIEFDLYRKVQPSELIGSVWTKVGKETNSPNLLKMIHFSTKITRWVSKTIIEISNHDERVAGMIRAIEVMQVMKQLNNFNGLLEFVAAFNSSAVHRLNHTKENLPDRYSKTVKECMDLCDSRLTKTLERLRSIDPPCVPFVGTFLTNILKTEEGNPHLLPNQPEHLELINFSKRRKVAAIMLEVQQYQNEPYNLQVVPKIRDFFLSLDPLEDRTEKQFNDHLFHTSLKIEPREVERPPKFPRLFTDKEIKSPGTAPSKRHVSRTMTKDDMRSASFRAISRESSFKTEKRHSLFEIAQSKPQSFDTMSLAFVPSTEPASTPSPKEESPPPRPPREPRRPSEPKDRNIDLVSAPPRMSDHPQFSFDMPSRLFRPVPDPKPYGGQVPPLSALPVTPATAPARTYNGHHVAEPEQMSPGLVEPHQPESEADPKPPPIPPRDASSRFADIGFNGMYGSRNPLFVKSLDRTSPTTPPPIPPRDPPTVPPRVPLRSAHPYTRNYPETPLNPHINGGRYVPDPTCDTAPPFATPGGWGDFAPHFENNLPQPHSEREPPTAFAFPDVTSRTWENSAVSPGSRHPPDMGQSSDVPPPIPRRQPSSATST